MSELVGSAAAGAASGAAAGGAMGGGTGAIIGAGIGAVGSLLGGIASGHGARRAISHQYAMQQKLIDSQNEYNQPINQRARLEAAGINPYLALGAGAVGNGNQPQAGSVSAPDVSGFSAGLQNASSFIANAALTMAQVRKTNAEAHGQEIGNKTLETQNELTTEQLRAQIDSQNIINAAAQYDLQKMKPAELQKLQGEIDNIAKDTALKGASFNNIEEQTNYVRQQIDGLKLDNKQKELLLPYATKLADLQIREGEMRVETGYQNAASQALSARSSMVGASAAAMNARTAAALMPSQRRYYGAIADKSQSDADLNDQQYRWNEPMNGIELHNARRSQGYNDRYYDNPDADWWNSTISGYIPFASGISREVRSWKKPSFKLKF